MCRSQSYIQRAHGAETPYDLFDALDMEFGPFTTDAAAAVGQRSANIILERGGRICVAPGAETDGNPNVLVDAFGHPWSGRVFLNPPHEPASLLTAFVEKASQEVRFHNAELVCALLPARTGDGWWQDHVLRDVGRLQGARWTIYAPDAITRVRFLPGRIMFVEAENQAPFPGAVVVWGASWR